MKRAAEMLCLLRLPPREAWVKSALIGAVAIAAIGAIASTTGLAKWSPQPLTATNLTLVAAMLVIPSLGKANPLRVCCARVISVRIADLRKFFAKPPESATKRGVKLNR